ncbi:MAG: NAD(P)/FAD-dependent oxidoreductase [Bacillota bacterium]
MEYVIIGNSAAGIFAAETIRGIDRKGNIIMVSAEAETPYSRCLTSYLISGSIKEKQIFIRPSKYYRELAVQPILGTTVVGIDVGSRELYLSNGNSLIYDRLLIATGASPYKPPIPGIAAEGVYFLRTLSDAKQIEQAIPSAKQAVVIGGGLVGLKAAKALRIRGLQVAIVEYFSHLMPQALDMDGAAFLHEMLEQEGYSIYLNTKVEKISTSENGEKKGLQVTGVELTGGQTVPCQMVIVAAGVTPNTGFLNGSEIQVNRGIPVNEYMQTNVPDIYAAGDVAETFDPLWEQYRINAVWPCATMQGQVAGCNMAGVKRKYHGSFGMNSAEFYGLPIISAGITQLQPDCQEYVRKEPGLYRKLVTRRNRLVGFITIGDVHGAGVLTGLMQKGTDISGITESLLNHPLSYASACQTSLRPLSMTGKEADHGL